MTRLKQRREEVGLSQSDVSYAIRRAVDRRVDVGMVSRYENGVCLPTADQIKTLEVVLDAQRSGLWDERDLDLLGLLPDGDPSPRPERGSSAYEARRRKTSVKRTYRVSRVFAESIPPDVLTVCGYSSWQSWHDAALKRLLGEYAARCKAAKK